MTAREAAETFINGNRKDCRDWCCYGTLRPFNPALGAWNPDGGEVMATGKQVGQASSGAAARVAAVALELANLQIKAPEDVEPTYPLPYALDFLRYMRGES